MSSNNGEYMNQIYTASDIMKPTTENVLHSNAVLGTDNTAHIK